MWRWLRGWIEQDTKTVTAAENTDGVGKRRVEEDAQDEQKWLKR